MPELRWTLLILGVIFIAVLAWWERRRPHQASRQTPHIGATDTVRTTGNTEPGWGGSVNTDMPRVTPGAGGRTEPGWSDSGGGGVESPPLGDAKTEPAWSAIPARGAQGDTPSLGDAKTEPAWTPVPVRGLRGEPRAPGGGKAEPTFGGAPTRGPRGDTPPAGDAKTEPAWTAARGTRADSPPPTVELPVTNPRPTRDSNLSLPEIRVRGREPLPPRELPVVEIPADSPLMGIRANEDESDPVEDEFADEEVDADDPVDEDAIEPIIPDPPRSEAERVAEYTAPVVGVAPPVVEWPPEDQRKLVSLRLVARPPDRFQGRLVRQALSAEGFMLGPFDIFHKADAQNRVILSAASLTKPGTFDLDTMDTLRYTGLNLFAVLPGPGDRSPLKAFEDLLTSARMLNERLEGALQDERGGPLTPTRVQLIRDGLVSSEAKP